MGHNDSAVVGVLPDILTADDSVLAGGLLNGGVELVAEAGLHGAGRPPINTGYASLGR